MTQDLSTKNCSTFVMTDDFLFCTQKNKTKNVDDKLDAK